MFDLKNTAMLITVFSSKQVTEKHGQTDTDLDIDSGYNVTKIVR